MNEETKELIKYRIERAEESLDSAKVLFNNGKLYSSVNRIYYAMFYSVISLLLTKGLSSSKHSGVMSLFFKEFVNKGLVEKDLGRFYADVFDLRMKSDYKIPSKINKEQVGQWLKKADEFVNEIKRLTLKLINE